MNEPQVSWLAVARIFLWYEIYIKTWSWSTRQWGLDEERVTVFVPYYTKFNALYKPWAKIRQKLEPDAQTVSNAVNAPQILVFFLPNPARRYIL